MIVTMDLHETSSWRRMERRCVDGWVGLGRVNECVQLAVTVFVIAFVSYIHHLLISGLPVGE